MATDTTSLFDKSTGGYTSQINPDSTLSAIWNPSLNTPAVSSTPTPAAVVTAKPAVTQTLQNQTMLNNLQTGLTAQQAKANYDKYIADQKTASDKVTADANAKADAELKLKQQEANTKAAALGLNQGTPTVTGTSPVDTDLTSKIKAQYTLGETDPSTIAAATGLSIDQVNAYKNTEQGAIDFKNAQTQKTADDNYKAYSNGTLPLSAAQQAQVDQLKNMYAQAIDAQKAVNSAMEASETRTEAMTGAARYSIDSKGIMTGMMERNTAKITALNTEMAGKVVEMEQAFRDGNYKAANDAAKTIQDGLDKKQALLTQQTKDLQAHIDELNKTATETKQKVQDGIDSISKAIAGAPQAVRDAVSNAKTVSEAINAAGDYLQTGTGDLGDYLQYKRDAIAKGLTPKDFITFKNEQTDRAATAKANAAGGSADTVQNLAQQLVTGNLAPSELSKRTTGTTSYNDVLKAADDYSMKTTGKHFNIATADRDYKFAQRPQTQDTLNYLKSLTGTVDKNGNISGGNMDELETISNSIDRTSFPALNDAKAWAALATGDPNYASYQAVATEVADQVAKILQGGSGSGGTSDAKLQQAVNLFKTGFTKSQINGIIDSLKPLLINRASAMIGDNPYLQDYAGDLGIGATPSSKVQVNNYISSNPTEAETIAKLYEVPGATDDDIAAYLKAQGKLK